MTIGDYYQALGVTESTLEKFIRHRKLGKHSMARTRVNVPVEFPPDVNFRILAQWFQNTRWHGQPRDSSDHRRKRRMWYLLETLVEFEKYGQPGDLETMRKELAPTINSVIKDFPDFDEKLAELRSLNGLPRPEPKTDWDRQVNSVNSLDELFSLRLPSRSQP